MSHPKTVIVTGASGGIGFEIAKAYIARGDYVIGTALNLEKLVNVHQALGNAENFHYLAGDISQQKTIEEIFQFAQAKFSKVDIVIHNAGIFIGKPAAEYSETDINKIIDINLRSFIYISQAVAKNMASAGGKLVVITAALAMQPNAKQPALLPILTKSGLNGAVKGLALELAPFNIQVNAVAPGLIETPMHGANEDVRNALKGMSPMHQVGQPADIANAVMYLTDSSFVTGTIMPVDGGSTSGVW
ncbi:SDR family NAD(P)-dependent oxidoreductase [Acinetobacter sichuanensis]|uniref:SDR family NAD(P)-dependent oxidoreductase n=1 Tax=Acinetobacter sichuanensis TaxID=2136183 RepID=UPI00280ECEEC|nr:SDR family NAD(P)-dependent oxidoreductase [Acinetobacter sichuanensis]MDQ9019951.1 SDR family NAD(P)-dependent oxidoreductase [Acinetobacter sichuanensis]